MIDDILAAYDWFDHPDGLKFVETHRDAHRSSGHWLFLPGVFSSFHKVRNNEELWLIHLGRVLVHVLDPDGATMSCVLEPTWPLANGQWLLSRLTIGKLRRYLKGLRSPSEPMSVPPHSLMRNSP